METDELVTDFFSSLNIHDDIIRQDDFDPDLNIIKQKLFQIFGKSCKKIELIDKLFQSYRVSYLITLEDGKEYILLFLFNELRSLSFRDVNLSEISTINYLHDNTNIPVPKIHYWNIDVEVEKNQLRVPFMIMDKLPGNPLVWNNLNFEQKCEFLNQYIDFLESLLNLKQNQIGSLYFNEKEGMRNFKIGKLVIDIRALEDVVNFGPFNSIKEWLNAAIKIKISQHSKLFKTNCELLIPVQEKMIEMIDKYWNDNPDYDFVLCPPLSENSKKILINEDDEGRIQISGFLDWRNTGFLPIDFLYNKYPNIIIDSEDSEENLFLQEHFNIQFMQKYQKFEKSDDEIRKLFFKSIIENYVNIWDIICAIKELHKNFNIELDEEWLILDDYFKEWFKKEYHTTDDGFDKFINEYNGDEFKFLAGTYVEYSSDRYSYDDDYDFTATEMSSNSGNDESDISF